MDTQAELAVLKAKVASLQAQVEGLQRNPSSWTQNIGNPAPLGLLSFGMTTLFLMYIDMEWSEGGVKELVIAYALWYGGVGQIIAGIWEMLKGNTFAASAFSSYGFFWCGWSLFNSKVVEAGYTPGSKFATGDALYLGQWGVLTFLFFLATLQKNRCLQAVFLLLSITFWLLAGGVFDETCKIVAGYFGFLTGLAAIYTAFAEIYEETYGRSILPGLEPLKKKALKAIDSTEPEPNSIQDILPPAKNV
ncbi:unnamed protein product [Vitrella brassicaformis CCMP3155]|uniref:Uncharacterized protein n=1 Tax=Vitrella brassicaformis (strain CCMP3155) TaxID=1169540 RepID=A0A0G4FF82_VITBC|nr:unnamed protein product [Vitrella brassicaformis CCMP3155]|eukprot:CEM11816.1 unnamed protein product [Vitrella brassicaformis CCMP3155]